ncbi:MAG: hypothetical protein E6G94_15850 [Alphaproteobacteria bacterium]|nr:MAG: hypothetical protein E6G94_15850 [Alphaproteobacteria bacterium]
MLVVSLLLQAAAGQPDIELNVRATARSVQIERKGEARLEVHAEPDSGGSGVQTSVTPKANGKTTLRNVRADIHAAITLADPTVQNRNAGETAAPQ